MVDEEKKHVVPKRVIVPNPKDTITVPKETPRVIAHTVSADDYKHFQESEARASDLDSLIMTERSIAKGERPRGAPVMQYVGAILALLIGGVIAWYIFQEIVLGGGGWPFGGNGGGTIPATMVPFLTLAKIKLWW